MSHLTQTGIEKEPAVTGKELFYQHLVMHLPAALYTCNAQGYITFYNDAAVGLWGREPQLGKDLWCGSWKIYHMDGSPMNLDECPMARTLKEAKAITGEE